MYPKRQKPNPTYSVSKAATQEALIELRKELDQVQTACTAAVKRLLWFRDYLAYKHLGYGSFNQFVKHELGRTRQWMWQHIKALPVAEYEAKLTAKSVNRGLPIGTSEPHSEPANAVAVKMGEPLVLSHKQRLEVAKLDGISQMKVMPVLIEKCPGADVEITRQIIDETLGRTEPKKDDEMDAVFTVKEPPAAAARIVELCEQIIDAAKHGTDHLYNVASANMQAMRAAVRKLRND